jgi:hypothetical protein
MQFIIVGLPIIGCGLVLALVRPSQPAAVDVGFIGYTNQTEGRFATFALTNRSPFTLRRWGYYEPQSKEHWQEEQHICYGFADAASLAPGQFEVISVPALIDRGTWRVVFGASRVGWRTKFVDWVEASPQLRGIVAHGPQQFMLSDWISP